MAQWYKKSKKEITEEDLDEFTRSKWIPVDSSWITDVAYYEPLGMLEIRVKNGLEYSFPNTSKSVFRNLMKAKSKGKYFNRIIRQK